jgi:hypothetical protein
MTIYRFLICFAVLIVVSAWLNAEVEPTEQDATKDVEQRLTALEQRVEELTTVLDARRFTMTIPPEYDGFYLKLVTVIDGDVKSNGGFEVKAGSAIVLYIRSWGKSLEYWAMTNEQPIMRAEIDNPLNGFNARNSRSKSELSPGDWIIAADREGFSFAPDGSMKNADAEIRVVLEKN